MKSADKNPIMINSTLSCVSYEKELHRSYKNMIKHLTKFNRNRKYFTLKFFAFYQSPFLNRGMTKVFGAFFNLYIT